MQVHHDIQGCVLLDLTSRSLGLTVGDLGGGGQALKEPGEWRSHGMRPWDWCATSNTATDPTAVMFPNLDTTGFVYICVLFCGSGIMHC